MSELVVEVNKQAGVAARFTDIKTQDDATDAALFIQEVIRPLTKKIDESFDPIIEKSKETTKEAQSKKAELLSPLKAVEKKIKTALIDYKNAVYQRQAEVVKSNTEIAIAAGVDDFGIPKRVEQAPLPVLQKIKGVSFQERLDFAIENEDVIPREYLTPDLAKIKQEVLKHGRNTKIVGIRVFEKPSVTVR